MKVLIVHQNFPGQYLHLARHLGATPGNEVVFITQRKDANLPGVKKLIYKAKRESTRGVHHYIKEAEAAVLNAQEVARVALGLKESGFVPDVMLAHNGWGELWYLKDVYPDVPLIGYFEFFYRYTGADVGFEPGPPLIFDVAPRIRTKNLGNLIGLDAADYGQCPTAWQKSLYPKEYHPKLHLIHEGIDTQNVVPNPDIKFTIPGTDITVSRDDDVVTYISRNLEPYRGFPSFMRSLPTILAKKPKARVIIVGGDDTSYGPKLADGKKFREVLLEELGDSLDLSRVHFLGKVPYSTFVSILQVSSVHVYLTYPFVLSWSMLEAMSAGCVIVGSRTPPVQEVIQDGVNGLLVDIFEAKQIAQRVIDVLSDRPAFAEIQKRARQTIIDKYDLRTVCLPAHLTMLEWVRIKHRDTLK